MTDIDRNIVRGFAVDAKFVEIMSHKSKNTGNVIIFADTNWMGTSWSKTRYIDNNMNYLPGQWTLCETVLYSHQMSLSTISTASQKWKVHKSMLVICF